MNRLFILDYSGTLTIFLDPAQFLLDLRRKYPEARVVLYTGIEKSAIDKEHPSLLSLMDEVWTKPQFIKDLVLGMAPDHLVLADDEPFTLRAYRRMFHNCGIQTVTYLSPQELKALVP